MNSRKARSRQSSCRPERWSCRAFTIAEYGWHMALIASLIIAVVTFVICIVGVRIGKAFGMKLARRASVFGGAILILIGLEIFLKGIL